MPFSMFCSSKGCGAQMEPYLDQSDNKVYCSACDNEIINVTSFVKAQMKSFKQFKVKKSIAFGVKCQKCNKEDVPILVKKELACPGCQDIHSHLSEPFKILLKDKLKNKSEDI